MADQNLIIGPLPNQGPTNSDLGGLSATVQNFELTLGHLFLNRKSLV